MDLMSEITKYIEDHLTEDLNVEIVAKKPIHLSLKEKSPLCRAFVVLVQEIIPTPAMSVLS